MTTISFNPTAASALSLLTGSTRALEKTQVKVASGKEVGSAADNAAYWSIAMTMGSHALSLSSAQDATGLATATVDTASLGIEAATGIVSDIRAKLILARSPGVDRDAINSEIGQLKEQLVSVSQSSSFSGQNWLSLETGQSPGNQSMVASVSNDAPGGTTVNTIEFDTSASVLVSGGNAADGIVTRAYSGTTAGGASYDYFLIDAGSAIPAAAGANEIVISAATTTDEIDGMISATDSMLSGLTNAGASLGATSSRISGASAFLADLGDIVDIGIGRLVDAHMEEQATKLAAQAAQQQLQLIGLNIANQQSRTLQSLFL